MLQQVEQPFNSLSGCWGSVLGLLDGVWQINHVHVSLLSAWVTCPGEMFHSAFQLMGTQKSSRLVDSIFKADKHYVYFLIRREQVQCVRKEGNLCRSFCFKFCLNFLLSLSVGLQISLVKSV